MEIKAVQARKILNSRYKPTIEVTVNGKYTASAPSGASTGSSEVQAFPKGGVDFAVELLNSFDKIQELEFDVFRDLAALDPLIPIFGGNTVVALQSAILKGISDNCVWKFISPKAKKIPLLLGNVVGGGMHTKYKSIDIQEILLTPKSRSIKDNALVNNLLHRKIGMLVNGRAKTDEGAWITSLSNPEALKKVNDLISKKSNTLGVKVELGVDMAASSFWKSRSYCYKNFSPKPKVKNLMTEKQIDFVNSLIKDYDLKYFEDPIREDDFQSFAKIHKKNCLVCGDDLITTNAARLQKAIRCKSVNCVIIKPNQIGSLTKAKEVVDMAKKHNIKCVISHRSGETMDTIISHLAVAWEIPYIKCGIYGKERKAKIDELIKIEQEIKK